MPNRNNNIPMIQQAREAMTQIITRINNTNPTTEEALQQLSQDYMNDISEENDRIIELLNQTSTNSHQTSNTANNTDPQDEDLLTQEEIAEQRTYIRRLPTHITEEELDYSDVSATELEEFYDNYFGENENFHIPCVDISDYTEEMKIALVEYIEQNEYADFFLDVCSRHDVEEYGYNIFPSDIVTKVGEDYFIKAIGEIGNLSIENIEVFLIYMLYERHYFSRTHHNIYINYSFDFSNIQTEENKELLKKGIREYILFCINIFLSDTIFPSSIGVETIAETQIFIDELNNNKDDVNGLFSFFGCHFFVDYCESNE